MAKRWTWALIALACSTGLFASLGRRSADVGTAGAGSTAPSASRSRIPEDLPQRHLLGPSKSELFAAPIVAAPTPPPPPQAAVAPAPPPNPYTFAGTSSQGGPLKVWLFSGNRVYEARAGQMLDDDYLVKSVRRDAVVLLHVPTNVEQRIERRP